MTKIALITGANKGIGFETARQLASSGGVHVILAARNRDRGVRAALALQAEGLDVEALMLDVTDAESIGAAVREVGAKFGRLDILINNAGIAVKDGSTTASGQSLSAWRTTFDTNLFGVIAVTQAFLPLLRKSEAGRIVNLSSVLASLTLHSDPDSPIYHFKMAAYNVSKTALNAWTVQLAYELRETSIKVNAAHPGYVKTDLGGPSAPMEIVDGAKTSVALALLGPGGPNGAYLHMGESLPGEDDIMKLLPILALASFLAACAVGPDFKPPVTPPATLVNAGAIDGASLAMRSPDGMWWRQFDDPVLDDLITEALASNLDLEMAAARVRAARAAFAGAKTDFAPHVPAAAGYAHSREQEPGFGTQRYDAESYTLGVDAAWELDLFGHVRRSVEAARGDLAAETEDLQYACVTVAAEVARNYFSLRSVQQQIKVAQDNLANARETVRLTSVRYDAGRGTELDLQSSRARMKATEALLPQLEISAAASRYRLAVLLGRHPGALDDRLAPVPVPAYARSLPIGEGGNDVRALLRDRPDVRAAERRLAAATARVGVATADLFPRVTVTGFVGFLSGDFAHLFSSSTGTDARAWSIAPGVSWPAFDYASVRARLRQSRANEDGAFVDYEKTVLNALEETENAFVGYREQQIRLKSLLEQAQASRRAAELAADQYREGVADFLTLLDAQRTQLAAESAVAETEGAVNVSVVRIYKALGGVGEPRPEAGAVETLTLMPRQPRRVHRLGPSGFRLCITMMRIFRRGERRRQ